VKAPIKELLNPEPTLVMRRGCTDMTQKRRCSHRSGSILHPQGPKTAQRVWSKVRGLLTVFFLLSWDCASQLCTRRPNYQQRILSGSHRSSSWCSSAQETGPVGLTQLSSASWRCPGSFIAPDQSFLAKHAIPVVCQAPYSPDMAPCDLRLFPKLKRPLNSSRFDSCEDIMRNATKELRSLPEQAFQKCFQQWKEWWAKCVESQGACFEGD
jgi:hypothetical protein